MTEIDVLKAREKLDHLIERAEAGEEVVITRDGKAVARLVPIVPAPPAIDRQKVANAIAAIRKMSESASLDGLKIKDLIEEGRL